MGVAETELAGAPGYGHVAVVGAGGDGGEEAGDARGPGGVLDEVVQEHHDAEAARVFRVAAGVGQQPVPRGHAVEADKAVGGGAGIAQAPVVEKRHQTVDAGAAFREFQPGGVSRHEPAEHDFLERGALARHAGQQGACIVGVRQFARELAQPRQPHPEQGVPVVGQQASRERRIPRLRHFLQSRLDLRGFHCGRRVMRVISAGWRRRMSMPDQRLVPGVT